MHQLLIAYHPFCLDHLTGLGHPESPNRSLAIIKALFRQRYLTEANLIIPKPATSGVLLLCHSQEYLDLVRNDIKQATSKGLLDGEYTLSSGDVQICPNSLKASLLACGAVLEATDAVIQGKTLCAFCPIRPPGHHASRDRGMGFCIFNNVAIAACYARQKYGIKRVLIVDWDVHHGNGTQDICFENPNIFYFSTHQSNLYPGTGSPDETGLGNILNCPYPGGKGSRLKVLSAFYEQLIPAMDNFKPEIVFISAGFDGHYADPLGGFDLTPNDFAELTTIMKSIATKHANGRIVSALEGGYNLDALTESVVAHVGELRRK